MQSCVIRYSVYYETWATRMNGAIWQKLFLLWWLLVFQIGWCWLKPSNMQIISMAAFWNTCEILYMKWSEMLGFHWICVYRICQMAGCAIHSASLCTFCSAFRLLSSCKTLCSGFPALTHNTEYAPSLLFGTISCGSVRCIIDKWFVRIVENPSRVKHHVVYWVVRDESCILVQIYGT